jgi:large subunit ribosomal protein L1
MVEIMNLEKAIEELKKAKERKFIQSLELIVNLKKFDVKKSQINNFVQLPNKIKDKKVCGFIEFSSELIDVISKKNFPLYKDKKKVKKLVEKYDFFIASGPNMPLVASTFGRVLGPAGKMPSPKLGLIMNESEEEIKNVVEKINKSVKIHTKEPCIKIKVGDQGMNSKELIENIKSAYNGILHELPLGNDNIRSIMIKLTMSHPIKVQI